jgi:hypothetical protein
VTEVLDSLEPGFMSDVFGKVFVTSADWLNIGAVFRRLISVQFHAGLELWITFDLLVPALIIVRACS